jgi:uncharacterized membrane protein
MQRGQVIHQIEAEEKKVLQELRELRRKLRGAGSGAAHRELTLGQRVADAVAATMGSWRFIIIQTMVLVAWVGLNVVGYMRHWDPYPFILLNLALSFQAAYSAPVIMMSQNRQQEIDRQKEESDHQVNIKAELEIELLHEKIDELRMKEVLALTEAVDRLTRMLEAAAAERKSQR